MDTLTGGINPNQDVKGMVADYHKQQAELDGPEEEVIPKEHMEVSQESIDLVSRGRLDPRTGSEIPATSKQRSTAVRQHGTVSPEYTHNYDLMDWD